MPLGMLYTMSHLAALGGIAPSLAIAAATGMQRAGLAGSIQGLLAAGKARGYRADRWRRMGGTQDNAAGGDPERRHRGGRRPS